jgi:hypothetical protein
MTTHQPAIGKTQPALPAALRARIDAIHTQMFDVIERMLAQLAAPQANASPLAARRQLANTLGLWHFCAQSKCRRSRCCRGEPKQCLHYALPLLPAETVKSLLATRKQKRQRKI